MYTPEKFNADAIRFLFPESVRKRKSRRYTYQIEQGVDLCWWPPAIDTISVHFAEEPERGSKMHLSLISDEIHSGAGTLSETHRLTRAALWLSLAVRLKSIRSDTVPTFPIYPDQITGAFDKYLQLTKAYVKSQYGGGGEVDQLQGVGAAVDDTIYSALVSLWIQTLPEGELFTRDIGANLSLLALVVAEVWVSPCSGGKFDDKCCETLVAEYRKVQLLVSEANESLRQTRRSLGEHGIIAPESDEFKVPSNSAWFRQFVERVQSSLQEQ